MEAHRFTAACEVMDPDTRRLLGGDLLYRATDDDTPCCRQGGLKVATISVFAVASKGTVLPHLLQHHSRTIRALKPPEKALDRAHATSSTVPTVVCKRHRY